MLSDISCIPASGVSRLSNHEVSFGEEEFEIWNFAKITNPLWHRFEWWKWLIASVDWHLIDWSYYIFNIVQSYPSLFAVFARERFCLLVFFIRVSRVCHVDSREYFHDISPYSGCRRGFAELHGVWESYLLGTIARLSCIKCKNKSDVGALAPLKGDVEWDKDIHKVTLLYRHPFNAVAVKQNTPPWRLSWVQMQFQQSHQNEESGQSSDQQQKT